MTIDEYNKAFLAPRTDKFYLLHQVKQENDLGKIFKIYNRVKSHPFVKAFFNKNILPKEFSGIRDFKNIPHSYSLVGEIAFYLIFIENNKGLINDFLPLKEDFECLVLKQEFDKADTLLQKIENSFGKSFWLIENKILLKEFKDGVKANWNELSGLSQKISDPLALFMIENLSKKAESKISYFRYLNLFSNLVDNVGISDELHEYLHFRLNYLGLTNYKYFSFHLNLESTASLIDRYILFRELLRQLLLQNSEIVAREEFDNILNFILQRIPNDKLIYQINNLKGNTPLWPFPSSEEIDELIQFYTIGNYNDCIAKAAKLILEYPDNIELYEIYCKSLIEVRQSAAEEKFPEPIQNIISVIFQLFSNQGPLENVLELGLKTYLTFSSADWAKQLLSIIQASTLPQNNGMHFTVSYIIGSKIKNPRILHFITDDRLDILNNKLFASNLHKEAVDVILNTSKGNYEYFISSQLFPSHKRKIYIGRALMNSQMHEVAISHYEKLYAETDGSELFKEEVLFDLYTCYLKLRKYSDACNLYVENYLRDKNVTKRLNKQELLDSINNEMLEDRLSDIEVPIFVNISTPDIYQQYVAYDTFLEKRGVNRPSEFIDPAIQSSKSLIFFLREVCTIEVMYHSYHFSGTDELENERLKILNILIVHDNNNVDQYIKEITELNQNASVRNAIREVNKGRISVNVSQLRKNELENIRESFSRYQEIEDYAKNNEIVAIDSTSMIKNLSILEDLIDNRVVYTNDPAFISFKVMFIEVRDKFILSKEYGLDGYLSTRIRHGTLLNHIRSVFESQNIISQKDKNNVYVDQDYWNQNLPHSLNDRRASIQNSIKKFSQEVDEYTEFLIKELIQIKTEKHSKNPKGLFDYSLGNNELALLFSFARLNFKDHASFLSGAFEYLQVFTERLLEEIREFITEDVKNKYLSLLNSLLQEIREILHQDTLPELINSVNLCGTEIHNELHNISEWFYLSNSSKDLMLDLNVLIQTSIQITNTINPQFQINPFVKDETQIQTYAPIHLIYIYRILLDNIIEHSKLSSSATNIEITTSVTEDNFLKTAIKNNFSEIIDVVYLNSRLETAKKKWDNSSDDFENIDIEGGSGFDKIRRIVVFDMNCKHYQFDYNIEGNTVTISLFIKMLELPNYEETI